MIQSQSKRGWSETLADFFIDRFTLPDGLVNLYAKLGVLRIPLRAWGDRRTFRLFRTVMPYTMVNYDRLMNVYEIASRVEEQSLTGAFVECGVWKGGCAAVMASVAHEAKSHRSIWLFDSFEGLPEPTANDGAKAQKYSGVDEVDGELKAIDRCVAPIEYVKRVFFERLHLDETNIFIRKGWFQESLPAAVSEIGPIAILRIDADWYESCRCCLDNLFDNVIPGGYVILDDYLFWDGCRAATDEFIQQRGLEVELHAVDSSAAWFQKPAVVTE